ncbi:helix-turn-helix domain-containing protein [Corynebacterium heidelbergense]
MGSLSPSALHRAFTRDIGMSPFTWLGRVRTAEMARPLREPDGSVEAIGRQVGRENRGHATRQFKARIELTPSQCRVAVRRT